MFVYISYRFYITLSVVVLVLASGYLWSPMFPVGQFLLLLFVVAVIADVVLLWLLSSHGQQPTANSHLLTAFRQLPDRFSNGDENEVRIRVENNYRFRISLDRKSVV